MSGGFLRLSAKQPIKYKSTFWVIKFVGCIVINDLRRKFAKTYLI